MSIALLARTPRQLFLHGLGEEARSTRVCCDRCAASGWAAVAVEAELAIIAIIEAGSALECRLGVHSGGGAQQSCAKPCFWLLGPSNHLHWRLPW
jgi:hypothetical protein